MKTRKSSEVSLGWMFYNVSDKKGCALDVCSWTSGPLRARSSSVVPTTFKRASAGGYWVTAAWSSFNLSYVLLLLKVIYQSDHMLPGYVCGWKTASQWREIKVQETIV
jgi:hypothetical protein